VTSDQFTGYVAINRNVQTAADITDEELCTGRQRVAGDAEVSSDANDSEMSEEADNDTSEPTAPPITLAAALQSLDTVRSYLMEAGCECYEHDCRY